MQRSIYATQQANTLHLEYTTATFTPGKPYVLVIDDDYAILSVLLLLLETEGYAGVGLLDSRLVRPFLEQAHLSQSSFTLPSAILLDVMMPALSGYDIAAWLAQQEWCRHIPIVIMTADPRIGDASMIHGATDCVSKPFQLDTLLAKLERYLPCPIGG